MRKGLGASTKPPYSLLSSFTSVQNFFQAVNLLQFDQVLRSALGHYMKAANRT